MATSEPTPTRRPGADYVGLSAGSAVLLVGAVVTAWLLRNAFIDSHRTVGWVVACSIVALLIEPLVTVADRLLPRAVAVIVVLLAMTGIIGLVGFGVINEVNDSLDELMVLAPEAAAELETQAAWAADVDLADRVQSLADGFDDAIRGDPLARAADTAPTYMVTGILMLFFLAGGRRYIDGFANQFAEPRRTRLRRLITVAGVRGRQWILWSLVVGFVVGVIVGGVSWRLDVPAAVSVGVLAGVGAVIPIVGTIVGGSTAILLAFGFEGRWAGLAMTAVVLALQIADAVWARRWIEARSVRVGATIPILCSLIGFELYGLGGAAYGSALGVIALAGLAASMPNEPDHGPEPAGVG
ncbi:MAG: AI-2E family transporter [Desertimonas sp.]